MLVGRTSCHEKAYLRCKLRICVRFVPPPLLDNESEQRCDLLSVENS